jgi:hypothetical protein
MNDMAAVTGQLARLRESLQQKQQELDGMASFSMPNAPAVSSSSAS